MDDLRAALADIVADRWGFGGFVVFTAFLIAGLLSGWLGRLIGVAAVVLNALPPHS